MQKIRIQNKWSEESKSFSQNMDLKENDKVITGKLSISSKDGEEWVNKAIPFIAFKSKIDRETDHAIRHSSGKIFDADITLGVARFKDKEGREIKYHRVIINSAKFEGSVPDSKALNGNVEEEDEIPF